MPAAVRSFWKGHLRLALVTIPVRLVSATASEETVHLHQVDRKSQQRIRYQKVTAEDARPVESSDIVRGVEVEPGRYVFIEDDDLDALRLDTRHTIELLEFVDPLEIEPLRYDRPYFVLPDGDVAEEGYRIIRDALRETGRCGIGQLTMRGREHLVAVTPSGKGMQVTTLRYEHELKQPDEVFAGIGEGSLRPELVTMAKQLVTERTTAFDPGRYTDHYAEALRDLVAAKAKGETIEVAGGGRDEYRGTVIDFMEALKRSVANETPPAPGGNGRAEPRPEPSPPSGERADGEGQARDAAAKPPSRSRRTPPIPADEPGPADEAPRSGRKRAAAASRGEPVKRSGSSRQRK